MGHGEGAKLGKEQHVKRLLARLRRQGYDVDYVVDCDRKHADWLRSKKRTTRRRKHGKGGV